jgi:hypothetical protein
MDCSAAIEMNRVALKRILAMLVAMAGLGDAAFTSPLRGGRRSPDRRVGAIEAPQPPPDASRRPPLKGEVALTLPRHLYLAILRLLRPAEAAARRLIIAAARGIVVTLPPPRKPTPKPMTAEPLLRRFGIAVVMSSADLAAAGARARRVGAIRVAGPRIPNLPLFDPPRRFRVYSRRYVPAHAAPRIRFPAITVGPHPEVRAAGEPRRIPPPPSSDDPIDATRLGLRLAALAAALDDLPGQAKRFARWKARHDSQRKAPAPGRVRRISPLRPGRPPGGRLSRFDPSARSRRNIRDVDEILAHAHALALYALSPDTS